MDFYVDTLRQLVADGRLDPAASTLVVAGGPRDRQAMLDAGFSNVTISNLDERMQGDEFAPCRWAFIDGEKIAFPDEAFDQVFVHMGLHHCGSPHGALLEMYRVAKKAVLAFENRDSATMRLAVRLRLVPEYELDAVRGNSFRWGGFRNTAVPNHVYRWTEREVASAIACIEPAHAVPLRFFYNLRYPVERLRSARGLRKLVLALARWPFAVFAKLFPRQGNEFGFFIDKAGRRLQPWIDPATGTLSPSYQGLTGHEKA